MSPQPRFARRCCWFQERSYFQTEAVFMSARRLANRKRFRGLSPCRVVGELWVSFSWFSVHSWTWNLNNMTAARAFQRADAGLQTSTNHSVKLTCLFFYKSSKAWLIFLVDIGVAMENCCTCNHRIRIFGMPSTVVQGHSEPFSMQRGRCP